MQILQILQVIIAVLLMIAILMQNKGSGLSGVFGGGGNVYQTKRGLEKTLFTSTIVLAVLFMLMSMANFMV